MKTHAVLLPRRMGPNVLTEAVLQGAATTLRDRGTTTIKDPDGETHENVKVSNVTVTDIGVEADLELDLIADIQSGRRVAVSMGCKVEGPPPCSLCDDEQGT